MMKRIWSLLLVLVLAVSLASCGKPSGSSTPSGSSGNTSAPGSQSQSADSGKSGEAEDSKGGKTAEAMIPGIYYAISGDDRDASVITGLTISGNRSGTTDYNSKPASTTGIRCIFELNEYVSVIPSTSVTSGLKVYVLKHREDPASYETEKFSEETPGFAALYEMDLRGENDWGDFYLNPDDCEAGEYDFVFVYKDKAIGRLQVRFYNEGELSEKADSELEALTTEWIMKSRGDW